jgi:xanthine dehydrogenase accessory factor
VDDLNIYEKLLGLKRTGLAAVLLVVVESSGSAPRKAGAKMLMLEDGSTFGSVGGGLLEAQALQAAAEVLATGESRLFPFSLSEDNGMVCGGSVVLYLESLRPPPRLIVVGAGHVGQALKAAAAPAGFAVTLVDPVVGGSPPRVAGFAAADLTCPATAVFRDLTVDGNSYIVIAAPSHRDDFRAVSGALETSAAYIGMLGSRRKREALRLHLQETGFSEQDIARVVTPAGLAIGAQTPGEIAVSILAQLIESRRNHGAAGRGTHSGGGTLSPDGALQGAPPLR